MRYRIGPKGKFYFVSLQGQSVDPQLFIDEFTKNSCSDIDSIVNELNSSNPDVVISISENTPKIIDGNTSTVVNPDGSITNTDPYSESKDTVKENQTTKNNTSNITSNVSDIDKNSLNNELDQNNNNLAAKSSINQNYAGNQDTNINNSNINTTSSTRISDASDQSDQTLTDQPLNNTKSKINPNLTSQNLYSKSGNDQHEQLEH